MKTIFDADRDAPIDTEITLDLVEYLGRYNAPRGYRAVIATDDTGERVRALVRAAESREGGEQ